MYKGNDKVKLELIVDIGRFKISYSIHSYTGELIDYRSQYVMEPETLLSRQGSNFLADVIVGAKSLKSEYPGIDKLILVIPTNDMLIKHQHEITPDMIINIMTRKYGITDDDGLVVAIGKPYFYNGMHYVPVSTYDEQIDILIEELNRVEGVDVSEEHNQLKMDTYFQTDINRIQKMGVMSHQREAIVDAGHSSTRVGIIDKGRLVDYREFSNLSGLKMIEYVYNNSDSNLQTIRTRIERSKELDVNEEVDLMKEFISIENLELKQYLREMRVQSVKIIGGLSNTDLLQGFEIPYYAVTLAESEFPEVPKEELYKVIYNQATNAEGSIVDPGNLELLSPKPEKKEEPIIEEKPKEKVVKPKVEYEEKPLKFEPKPIKKAPVRSPQAQKIEPQSVEEIPYVSIKIPREYKPTPKDLKFLEYEWLHEYEESIKKQPIDPLPEHIKRDIEAKKMNYREPPHKEPKSPVILTGVVTFMVCISMLFMLHYSGKIETRVFEVAGIATETTVSRLETRQKALEEYSKVTAKRFNIPEDALILNSKPNYRLQSLEFEVLIPKDLTKVEEFKETLVEGFKEKDARGNWDIKTYEEDKGFFKVTVKGRL